MESELRRYGITPGRVNDLAYLQVELTDRCNLACASCPRATAPSSKNVLGVSQFEDILVSAPSIRHVSFVGGGEAFLLKNFADYVAICSQRKVVSSVNTNGILVERRLQQAVDAGLGRVAISVDAADDLLMQIRSGLSRAALEKAMRLAVAIVRGRRTQVSAAVTLGRRNLHQFADTMRLIANSGIRIVTVESIHHWGENKSLNAESLFAGEAASTIAHVEAGLEVGRSLGLQVDMFDRSRLADPRVRGRMHCAWPWDASYVTCGGEVTPCCVNLAASDANRMGRLSEASLPEIWRGEAYQRFRRDSLEGRDWPFCSECVYRMQFGEPFDE